MYSRKMRLSVLMTLVIGAAAVSGGVKMRVNSYAERGADLTRYHSFRWSNAEATPTGDPRLDNNRFFDERVRAQVEQELEKRGFEKTDSAQSDLLVHYHASFAQEVDVRDLDPLSHYCDTEDCRPFVYDKGTLFIDLVEPGSGRLVWRGWAEGSFDGVIDNQSFMDARIDEAVIKIMGRLPHMGI
jgi:hypothetical protein